MCSIAMPAELILHSPPVYSPLLYGPLVVTAPTITSRSSPRIRPCLSSGSLSLDSLRNNDGKQKKRVVFADDRGRPLTQVRVMSEPSNVPPLWSTAYVAGLTGGLLNMSKALSQEAAQDSTPPWQVTFPQPASDYLAFRRKLDQDNVSLENVIVRESEQCLVGTVKVRNLAYDKEIVVRATSDSWSTHEDVHCTYVAQPGSPGPLILYDTFRFRLTLPVTSNVIEFCVRYRSDGKEMWDNNDGKNYVVRKKQDPRVAATRYDSIQTTKCDGLVNGNEMRDGVPQNADATRLNMRTWSEFASWQHLTNDAPYW
ncbi:protein phosphatase 1 regulatory subunit 3C-like isoform X1 [Monomorium pharaonis]|uniref:protein phosphatase 1 regulatory subunit 3C isoform X1 n=1 Tax=Monomorium pharaonis TaxID=307658 RepID=UPI00063F1E96|nr:protein phosphatase 1 regulatory subunit 3C isoform X1 [Monomorium pharaonis]XP_036149638.1 protein phosphatase 1 regulatory subunit 3C-like isoform X1 [Monomorium pharaonis]